MFRKTKLSDEFDFEDAQENLPDSANMLLLVRGDGDLRFFTHAARPEPCAGDTILSFLPPQLKTREDAVAKRAAKDANRKLAKTAPYKPNTKPKAT